MTLTMVVLVVVVVFAGALMRATFGFGEAVISMPLLALLPISLNTSISLIGLAGLTVAGMTITSGWRHIDRQALIWLSVATLLGIPVGLALVKFAPAGIVTKTLGIFLIIYSLYSLVRGLIAQAALPAWFNNNGWIFPFGFVAGALGSAYNVTGIPVVVYGTLRRWNQSRFHSTLQAHFLVAGIFVVIGQALGGLWTANLFMLYGLSLPAIIIATLLGLFLHRRIPADKFKQYVFFIIMALGILLLVNPA
ncbi:sulfite exporter TauE/SafE family protein [Ktedonosporobacter rubrisoli]|uniref:Probable membrane transporter protein n=1 Tax=Ktedonosporobacter rubrisoli TaxID=2509675 RepID=A0A4P6JLI7_KTERU|nr:sulfite exporter TauE/SafE family protein [Ktedonosporobacter rubrisoli]QBD75526.1 sulfite exporter TauE/SafE family protein [Ktedonosporobacter rubrisoli]